MKKLLLLIAIIATSVISSNAQIRTTYDGLKKMKLDVMSCTRLVVNGAVRIDINVTGIDWSGDAVFSGSDGYKTTITDNLRNSYNVYVTAGGGSPTSGEVSISLKPKETKYVSFYIYNVDKNAKYISFDKMSLLRGPYSSRISINSLPIK